MLFPKGDYRDIYRLAAEKTATQVATAARISQPHRTVSNLDIVDIHDIRYQLGTNVCSWKARRLLKDEDRRQTWMPALHPGQIIDSVEPPQPPLFGDMVASAYGHVCQLQNTTAT